MNKSRRTVLKTVAGASLLPILPAAERYKWKVVKPDERKSLMELIDVIIPRTDTPGASDVKVHEYIDFQLANNPARAKLFHEGLRVYQQKGLDDKTPFFRMIKDLTIDGYYSSREGLSQELGWKGNTYAAKFQGCTHPEHQR